MENDGLKFYQIFNIGGFIGVNGFSLGEMVGLNIISLIITIGIFGLFATLLPFLFLAFYILFLLLPNSEGNSLDKKRANVFGILSYIYVLIDYHFGFIGWSVISHFTSPETMDLFVGLNTVIFLINILLLFYGDTIFNEINYGIVRVGIFLFILYFTINALTGIATAIITSMVSQHVAPPVVIEDDENINEQKEWVFNSDYLNKEYQKERAADGYYDTTTFVGPGD